MLVVVSSVGFILLKQNALKHKPFSVSLKGMHLLFLHDFVQWAGKLSLTEWRESTIES